MKINRCNFLFIPNLPTSMPDTNISTDLPTEVIKGEAISSMNSIQYIQMALEISEKIGNNHGKVLCLDNLGVSYNRLGDFQRGWSNYEKAFK